MNLSHHRKPLIVLFLTFGLYFYTLFPRILQIRSDGIYAGHVNVWSDWSLHIGMAQIFATKAPAEWFAYHPMYAQGKFTYGFVTNLVSGMLMRVGLPVDVAFIMPSLIYVAMLLPGLYVFFYLLFKSRSIALVSISLFFLSSGLGGIYAFLTQIAQDFSWHNLLNPQENYSAIPEIQWYAGNVIVGLLVPQRAFLLGMTIAIWSLNLFLLGLSNKHRKLLLIGGLLAGFLPIIHMHSLIALILITATASAFVIIKNVKRIFELLYYALPAGLISFTLYSIFIAGGIENPHFMKLDLGWSAKTITEWIGMWFNIWGLMIPVAVSGFIIYILKSRRVALNLGTLFGFVLIFIIANIIVFQPVYWDNSKLFFWSYLGFSGLAAYMLVNMWRRHVIGKSIALLIFIALSATGIIELLHLQQVNNHSHRMISTEEINLAEEIRANTSTTDIFLTDTSHNHWVMMWAARPIVIGFTPWVWNFGFDYSQTEKDARDIYAATPDSSQLIQKHQIHYVVMGPSEIRNFRPNRVHFLNRYPVAFSSETIEVFDVSGEWQQPL
jgi:hypothetical protein